MATEVKLGEIVKRTYQEPLPWERKNHILTPEGNFEKLKNSDLMCWVINEKIFEYEGKSYLSVFIGYVNMEETMPHQKTTALVLGEIDEKGYQYDTDRRGRNLTDVILVADREKEKFRDYLKEKLGKDYNIAFWGGLL